jgi:DNA-binding Xre family transcriptional regulator
LICGSIQNAQKIMIVLSLGRLFSARGIAKPYGFLVKNGFTPTTATKLVSGNVEYLRLDYIERLANLLNCAPNDMFEWKPASRAEDKPDHPLYSLKRAEDINLAEALKSLPYNKLKEIGDLIHGMQ